jgi:hypothetical protein
MSGRSLSTPLVVALSCVGLAALFAVSLAQGLGRELIHDEHQFVAPGALLVSEGLLPYVDYPYFHMPLLAFLYGGAFIFTDHLLLGARLVSVLFGWLLLIAIFRSSWRVLSDWGPWARGLAALSGCCLLFFNPLFLQAHGLTWNHDGGVFFATLGMLCLCRTPGRGRESCSLLLAGLCLAFATGIRLSYAPLAIPFALLAFRMGEAGQGMSRVLRLALGGVIGSLPVFFLMAAAPTDFFFGNLRYPLLNTEWYASEGNTTAMTLGGKLAFLGEQVMDKPPTWALLVATFAGLLAWLVSRRSSGENVKATLERAAPGHPSLAGAAFLCFPFALAGAFAPSPSWPQYYVAVIPFLVLGSVGGLASLACQRPLARVGVALLVAAGCLAVLSGRDRLQPVSVLADRSTWEPLKVHAVGEQIGERVGAGLVFSETPIYPLEGGARIYDFHVVGPFTFRTGHLLSKEERLERGVYAFGELPMILEDEPPAAILTGADGWMARPTKQYARREEFLPFALKNGFILFYRP